MPGPTETPGLVKSIIKPFTVTVRQMLKSTFGRPQTTLYPMERRELPPTYRGMNAVIWDLCIGCGICAEVCPNRCLKMKPETLDDDEQARAWYGSLPNVNPSRSGRPSTSATACSAASARTTAPRGR